MILLRPYQQEQANDVIAVFRSLAESLSKLTSAGDRAAAVSHDGCILLTAPTGAGKTVVAGEVAQQLALKTKVVWFWFAPFKGLVDQTEGSLRAKFPGLRLRRLAEDRRIDSTQAGDCWVTTWQLVATGNVAGRRVRMEREDNPSVDTLVRELRKKGFLIGTIVDEAHYGFRKDTEAMRFYLDVLKPEFTFLVTATPDDKDAEAFRKAAGFQRMARASIRREAAVSDGMVKPGIRSVAFLAKPGQEALVDFEQTALREATRRHREIKAALKAASINLVPLMLVQVDSPKGDNKHASVTRAKDYLIEKLGFREDQVASYTADEPDASLKTIADDHSKEVLIFKMAVALGFDAPRAWTLVSMRAVTCPDFGTQIVGRLMRVHPSCQGRELPPMLNNAYVFLADKSAQPGLEDAADKINQLKSEFAKVSGYAVVVQVAGESQLQVVRNGQTFLLPTPEQRPSLSADESAATGDATDQNETAAGSDQGLLQLIEETTTSPTGTNPSGASPTNVSIEAGQAFRYPRRAGMPARLRTDGYRIVSEGIEEAIVAHFPMDERALLDGLRRAVEVTKIEKGLFGTVLKEGGSEQIQAVLDMRQTEVQAQGMLFSISGVPHPKTLNDLLVERVRGELRRMGRPEADNDDEVECTLAMILVQNPAALRAAHRRALAAYLETTDASELPESVVSDTQLPDSKHNIYGVMPSDLNSWERPFAEWLDTEAAEEILWWHRNPPRRAESVRVMLPDGTSFYPDFAVAVKGRPTRDGVLLIDTKFGINDSPNAKPKAVVRHTDYGRTMILYWQDKKHWMTVRYDEKRDMNDMDQKLHVGLLRHFA